MGGHRKKERWVLIGSNEQKVSSPILLCQKNACWQLLSIVSRKKRFLNFGMVPKFKRTRIGTQDSEKGDGKKQKKYTQETGSGAS